MRDNIDGGNSLAASGVVSYLVSEGWHSSKASFYRHRREGKIRPQTDGTYTIAAIRKYAKTFLRRFDTTILTREAFDREIRRRVAVIRSDLEVLFRCQAADMVALVAGDPGKVSDLINFLLDHTEGCIGMKENG